MIKDTHLLFTSTGNNYVLSTSKPFACGLIWRQRSEQENSLRMEEFRTNGKTVCQVEGYNIFVMFDGSLLLDNIGANYSHSFMEGETEKMASYYLTHIQSKPRAYTRYEVKTYKPLFQFTENPVL
jgi:hypothetical protein